MILKCNHHDACFVVWTCTITQQLKSDAIELRHFIILNCYHRNACLGPVPKHSISRTKLLNVSSSNYGGEKKYCD